MRTYLKSPNDQISNALDLDVQLDGRAYLVANLVVHCTSKIEVQRRTWIYKMKMEQKGTVSRKTVLLSGKGCPEHSRKSAKRKFQSPQRVLQKVTGQSGFRQLQVS